MSGSPEQSKSPTPPGTLDVPVPADSPTSFSTMAAPAGGSGGGATAAGGESPRPRRLVGPRRQLVIVFGITSSLILAVLTIGVLYMKWYGTSEYNTKIIVWGEREWVGAKVTVDGPLLQNGPLVAELSDPETPLIRFHVPPGEYVVRVTRDGRLLGERKGRITSHTNRVTIWWPFKRPPIATQPSEP
jgi:hypothetical protein